MCVLVSESGCVVCTLALLCFDVLFVRYSFANDNII